MRIINRFLISSKSVNRSAVVWNAVSATMNSFQTMVLLMVITRFGTMEDSSIFVIAYAIGNLMLNVGKFGVRQFQVTDVAPKYTFKAYLYSRVISCAVMFIFTVLYIGYNVANSQYTATKALIVFVICFVKMIEAFEDVYGGLMQQNGRLDVAAKILGVRMCVFVAGCIVLFLITRNLLLTVAVNALITLLISYFLNRTALNSLGYTKEIAKSKGINSLMLECLPLCVCMCLNMYVANAPKYTVDTVVSDEVQTCFNIVFMPVFVIALLANFIFQPCLKDLGDVWNDNKTARFIKRILVLSIAVIAVCFVVTVVGAVIGTDILGFIYKVDLEEYNNLLILFMMCGGIIALQNLLIMAITVVRYQKYMLYGYVVSALVLIATLKPILNSGGLFITSLMFALVMLALLIYCVLLLVIAIIKNNKRLRV